MSEPTLRRPVAFGDQECVRFLQWALPRVGLRWRGFRKPRRQLRRRLRRRVLELDLPDLVAYREYLEHHAEEWRRFDRLCRVTISRFARDRAVFEALGTAGWKHVAACAQSRGCSAIRSWSGGCASGEEPYSLAISWQLRGAGEATGSDLSLIATDIDLTVLARARQGVYEASSLRELPSTWRRQAFERQGEHFRLRSRFRQGIAFAAADLREAFPEGRFDLVLWRNLVFTYFDLPLQRRLLLQLGEALDPGGLLVIGSHESLPPGTSEFLPWPASRGVFRRRS